MRSSLDTSRYVKQHQIYHSDLSTVYEALDTTTNSSIVIKSISASEISDVNAILNECMLQRGLVHPNICQILTVFLEADAGVWRANIVLEKSERDLENYVKVKKTAGGWFSEQELFKILEEGSAALEFAKKQVKCKQNIAHRDVKPGNIFISSDGTFKLGDFGSARQINPREANFSVVGTLLYLSPQLLQAFSQSFITGLSKASYDIFKSDVYSLGLTVLYAARMGSMENLNVLSTLEANIERSIAELPHSDSLKNVLRGMLQFHEAARMDIEKVHEFASQIQRTYQVADGYMTVQQNSFPRDAAGTFNSSMTTVVTPQSPQQFVPVSTRGVCVFCGTHLRQEYVQFQVLLECGKCIVCTQSCRYNHRMLACACY